MIIDSAVITGSLVVSGSKVQSGDFNINGNLTVTGSLSVNGSNAVLSNQTSSFSTNNSLNSYTSSINAFSASILSYTASNNTTNTTQNNRLAGLESYTSSLNTATSSFVQNAQTGAFATFTALNAYTSSLNSYTSSNDTTNTTQNNRIAGLESYTSSINTATSSFVRNNQTSSMSVLSSSFAATASFAGNFTVANTLTAQTLVVQTVSSSVVYSSGSNVFGNSLANTQVLTGSVIITGSASVNGSNIVLTNQTASLASLNSYTSSNDSTNTTQNNRIAGLESYTSSLNSATSSFTRNSQTSSFAITGSNTFNGNQVISGSLTVFTGSGVELQVTNNGVRIGNIPGDVHNITGSLNVSGSTNINIGAPVSAIGLYVDTDGTGGSAGIGVGSTSGPFLVGNTRPDGTVRGAYGGSRIGFTGAGFSFDYSSTTSGTRSWSTYMSIDTSGRVGIGTTSPVSLLTIKGSSNYNGVLSIDSTGALGGGALALYQNGVQSGFLTVTGVALGTSGRDLAYYANAGLGHVFYTNDGSERMRITSGGNVGIGTSSPDSYPYGGRLNVNGNISVNGTKIGWGVTDAFTLNGIDTAHYGLSSNFSLVQLSGYYGVVLATDGAERMRIAGNGNVGIGTTSPGNKLDVIGNVLIQGTQGFNATGETASIYLGDSASEIRAVYDGGMDFYQNSTFRMRIQGGTGNVGIGTTSADERLTIRSGNIKLYSLQNSANDYRYIGTEYDSGNGNNRAEIRFAIDGSDTNTRLTFHTANGGGTINERMRITSAGNVGIGTTAPQKPIEVISNANDFVSVGVNTIGVGQWTGIHFGYRESNNNYRKSAIVFERTDLTASDAQGKIHILNGPQGNSNNATLAVARLTVAENGNVGVGTTSPGALLHVAGTSYAGTMTAYAPAVHIRGGFFGGPRLQVYGLDADANGWMGLGTDMSNSPYELSVYYPTNAASSVCFGRYNGSTSQYGGFTATARLSHAGTWTVAGDVVAYGSPSDVNLKTNIKPLEGALDKIIKLQGVSFTWKEGNDISKLAGLKDDLGFIAQEVQEIFPELVRRNEDTGLLSLRDKGIIPVLVESIKEQQQQIEELKELVNKLINK